MSTDLENQIAVLQATIARLKDSMPPAAEGDVIHILKKNEKWMMALTERKDGTFSSVWVKYKDEAASTKAAKLAARLPAEERAAKVAATIGKQGTEGLIGCIEDCYDVLVANGKGDSVAAIGALANLKAYGRR